MIRTSCIYAIAKIDEELSVIDDDGRKKFISKTDTKMRLYIGKTIDFESRMMAHRNKANNSQYTKSPKLYNCIRKYGFESFDKIIIESSLTEQEAYEREIFWIAEFNSFYNGLNSTPGGEGVGSGEHNIASRPIRLLDLDSMEEFSFGWVGAASIFLGVGHNNIFNVLDAKCPRIHQVLDKTRKRRFAVKDKDDDTEWDTTITGTRIPVSLFNITTHNTQHFKSIEDAANFLGVSNSNVNSVLRGTHRQVYDSTGNDRYLVKRQNDDTEWDFNVLPKEFPVISIRDGLIIGRYKSAAEASRMVERAHHSHILKSAHHVKHYVGGFLWEFEDEELRNKQPDRKKKRNGGNPAKEVYTFRSGSLLSFKSITIASKETGISIHHIKKSLNSPDDSKIKDSTDNAWYFQD